MTRVLLVIGHARRAGLGHRLLGVARDALAARGAEVREHDLLADGFEPRLRLADDAPHAVACERDEDPLAHRYQTDVRWADAYVVAHPAWWFAPPAILKGWVDRVLVDGVALRQRDAGPPEPLLGGRRALVVQTFNATRAIDRGTFGGLAGRFWTDVVFPSVGVRDVERLALYEARELEPARLARFEEELRAACARLALPARRGSDLRMA